MERELTPIEAASYYAHSFSYNMYNDMLLFMTLSLISSTEDIDNLSIDELIEGDIMEELYCQILSITKYKAIGIS